MTSPEVTDEPDLDETAPRTLRSRIADRRRSTGPGGRRLLVWSVPTVAVLVIVFAVAYFTPLLAVRSIRIEGLTSVPEQQVRDVADIPSGQSMLRIDTDAIAGRVAALPKVRSARVRRIFPATVRVSVQERRAVVFYDSPQGQHVLDGDGVEFAIEPAPPGVPRLTTDHPGSADPVTRAAVRVAAVAPPALLAQVGEVVARSVSNIELKLRDGRTVDWGGVDDSERKAAVVLPALTREGTVFDVSSPDLVTVK
ncbi:MAG: FtsQ-type POTRA domain-containing protein [Nocardia sp.]|nr:FtsQ-type POTRA domain-containing protein [Nocardia sp.]